LHLASLPDNGFATRQGKPGFVQQYDLKNRGNSSANSPAFQTLTKIPTAQKVEKLFVFAKGPFRQYGQMKIRLPFVLDLLAPGL